MAEELALSPQKLKMMEAFSVTCYGISLPMPRAIDIAVITDGMPL